MPKEYKFTIHGNINNPCGRPTTHWDINTITIKEKDPEKARQIALQNASEENTIYDQVFVELLY